MLTGILCELPALSVQLGGRQMWVESPPAELTAKSAIIWLRSRSSDVLTDRERLVSSGLHEDGYVLAFVDSTELGWRYANDKQVILEAHRWLRKTYLLDEQHVFLAGQSDGAVLAHRMVVERPYWFGGAMLVLGAYGGHWQPHATARPVFGIYGTPQSRAVPIAALRGTQKRLLASDYPVVWQAEMVDAGAPETFGDRVFAMMRDVMVRADERGVAPAADHAASAP